MKRPRDIGMHGRKSCQLGRWLVAKFSRCAEMQRGGPDGHLGSSQNGGGHSTDACVPCSLPGRMTFELTTIRMQHRSINCSCMGPCVYAGALM